MTKTAMAKAFETLLGISGALLIIWWLLLGITQAAGDSGQSFAAMVQTPSWLPVNIVGMVAMLVLVVALSGWVLQIPSGGGALRFLGVVISVVGVVLFGAVQFDETFVWPLLAEHAPSMMEPAGPMFTDPAFLSIYLLMGVFFAAGFVLVAIDSIRSNSSPLILNLMLIIGAVLFAGGSFMPLIARSVGVLLFGASLIWQGFWSSGSKQLLGKEKV